MGCTTHRAPGDHVEMTYLTLTDPSPNCPQFLERHKVEVS